MNYGWLDKKVYIPPNYFCVFEYKASNEVLEPNFWIELNRTEGRTELAAEILNNTIKVSAENINVHSKLYEKSKTFIDKGGIIHYLAGYWVDNVYQNAVLIDSDGKFEAHLTSLI